MGKWRGGGGLETPMETAVYCCLKKCFANFTFFWTDLFLSKDQNTNIAPTWSINIGLLRLIICRWPYSEFGNSIYGQWFVRVLICCFQSDFSLSVFSVKKPMIDENFATAQYSTWKDLVGFYLDTWTNLVDYFHVRPFLGLCNRAKEKKGLTFSESVAF